MDPGVDFLVRTQLPSGGWAYAHGSAGFVEPTSLAVLALLAEPAAAAAAARGVAWLGRLQNPDGGWGALEGDRESGWATAVAVLALAQAPARPGVERGSAWLLGHRSRSVKAPANNAVRLDAGLVGWGWTVDTLGWVVPTSLSMLALVAAGAAAADQLEAGRRLLVDRACAGGGWNWGNPDLFGSSLPPTAQETALAVLALVAVRAGSAPEVTAGLNWLDANGGDPVGPAAVAWSVLARSAGGRPVAEAVTRLRSARGSDGGWAADPRTTALATLALAGRGLSR